MLLNKILSAKEKKLNAEITLLIKKSIKEIKDEFDF